MVRKRFKTSVNIAKTRSFPGADIGSDHELVMMTYKLHMKRATKQCSTRIRFDLEKLKDPEVAEIFQAKIGRKFAALSILDSDMDMYLLTNAFNTAVTDTANEILGKYLPVKKPWVTTDILDLCAKRRKLKNNKNNKDRDGIAQYRAVNQKIRKAWKMQKTGEGSSAKQLMTAWRTIAERYMCWFKIWSAHNKREPQPYKAKVEHIEQKMRTSWRGGQNTAQSCTITEPQETQKCLMSLQQPITPTTPSSAKK